MSRDDSQAWNSTANTSSFKKKAFNEIPLGNCFLNKQHYCAAFISAKAEKSAHKQSDFDWLERTMMKQAEARNEQNEN